MSVRVAPRRWRLRGEVEHESRRIAKLDLLANAVVGLVRASTTDVYGPQPIPSPLGQQIDALGGALERLASAPQPWPSELPAEIASVVAAVTERATAFAANRVEIVGSIVRAAAADLAAAIDVHD